MEVNNTTKINTKEEILEHLIEELEEELEGIKEYENVYNSLVALGLYAEADVIEDIAGDEYKHACALRDMLMEHGADLSHHEKIQKGWECVKAIFDI